MSLEDSSDWFTTHQHDFPDDLSQTFTTQRIMMDTSDEDNLPSARDHEDSDLSSNEDIEVRFHEVVDLNNNEEEVDIMEHMRQLLPDDFDPGTDGMGACNIRHMKHSSCFRRPWLYSDEQIQNLIRISKKDFFLLVNSSIGSRKRKGDLNVFAECFLLLYKLCHNPSFHHVASLFGLSSSQIAFNVFYSQLIHQFQTNCNVPLVIKDDCVNEEELDKLLSSAYLRTPLFYKNLVKNFEDPAGRGRTPVILNIDATYFNIEGSDDIELQKYM